VLGSKVVARFGEDLSGKRFAVWGLAFKPNTDDMREAPSRVLLAELIERGATVAVHDPVAMAEARRVLALDLGEDKLSRIEFKDTPMDALDGAEALLIVTEWKAFRSPDFDQIKARLKQPVIIDGRNLYEPALMTGQGVEYHGIGRSVLAGRPAQQVR
jgi:UDPglucose 6-dehydrogenase